MAAILPHVSFKPFTRPTSRYLLAKAATLPKAAGRVNSVLQPRHAVSREADLHSEDVRRIVHCHSMISRSTPG